MKQIQSQVRGAACLAYSISLFLLASLLSSCGTPEENATLDFWDNDRGLCELSNVGGDFISGYIPSENYKLTPYDRESLEATFNQMEEIANEIYAGDTFSMHHFNEALRDLRYVTVTYSYFHVRTRLEKVAANLFKDMFNKGGDSKPGLFGKAMRIFGAVPYINVLADIIKIFQDDCSGREAREAIRSFVSTSIVEATNENLKRIWKNADQDAQDELDDIQRAVLNIQELNEPLLSSKLRFARSPDEMTGVIVDNTVNIFENHYLDLRNSVEAYYQRYMGNGDAIWGLKHAKAFKGLMDLTLTLYKHQLTAAKQIDTSYFDRLGTHRAAVDRANFLGDVTWGYQDYLSLLDKFQRMASSIAKHNGSPRLELVFHSDMFEFHRDYNESTISVPGVAKIYLFGKHLISFNTDKINLYDLMKEMPLKYRHLVPTEPKVERSNGVRNNNRLVTRRFNEKASWPGKQRVVSTSCIRRRCTDRYDHVPSRYWLAKGEAGFYNFIFNDLKVHETYFKNRHPKISKFYQELKGIVDDVYQEYLEYGSEIRRIKHKTYLCKDGLEGLKNCRYFSTGLVDSLSTSPRIVELVKNLAEQGKVACVFQDPSFKGKYQCFDKVQAERSLSGSDLGDNQASSLLILDPSYAAILYKEKGFKGKPFMFGDSEPVLDKQLDNFTSSLQIVRRSTSSNQDFLAGCTDPSAVNYGGSQINFDDGTCTWEAAKLIEPSESCPHGFTLRESFGIATERGSEPTEKTGLCSRTINGKSAAILRPVSQDCPASYFSTSPSMKLHRLASDGAFEKSDTWQICSLELQGRPLVAVESLSSGCGVGYEETGTLESVMVSGGRTIFSKRTRNLKFCSR